MNIKLSIDAFSDELTAAALAAYVYKANPSAVMAKVSHAAACAAAHYSDADTRALLQRFATQCMELSQQWLAKEEEGI